MFGVLFSKGMYFLLFLTWIWESNMGNDHSKPETDNNRQRIHSMATPAVTCAPCLSGHLDKEHLVLAFFAGVLLTLLLMAFVLLITKSCRKCHSSPRALDPHSDPPATVRRHSSPQALDPHSDPPATVSSPGEALTYASMTFKISKESSDSLTMNHSADADPVVYAQIKVTDSRRLSREA